MNTFLFHPDDDIYVLEAISNKNTESNKCFYYTGLLGVLGNMRKGHILQGNKRTKVKN